MAYTLQAQSEVKERFFKPLAEILEDCRARRQCPVLPDELWFELGLQRCLMLFQSGRDMLQCSEVSRGVRIGGTTFFESLKSKRRMELAGEALRALSKRMARIMPDPFEDFPCLADFDIHAGDGHFVAAACHDETAGDGVKYATPHIYTLDLRSQAMGHLDVADQISRKKEHEMRTLKRQDIETLRRGAAPGRKVLYVWDPASLDYRQWTEWKMRAGIYFLSREKDNSAGETIGLNPFGKDDPVNQGVVSDEIIATTRGVSLRRVVYRDPETGTLFRFLTNLPPTVPPGLVALLYKMRWDVEKVFDEFKNKFGEKKSRATSATAKKCQARLQCAVHNLLRLMEEEIRLESGIVNRAELERKARRLEEREEKSLERGGGGVAWLVRRFERITQISVKFIRWVKSHWALARPWKEALDLLASLYARL